MREMISIVCRMIQKHLNVASLVFSDPFQQLWDQNPFESSSWSNLEPFDEIAAPHVLGE